MSIAETTAPAAEPQPAEAAAPSTLDEVTSERLLSTLTGGTARETAAPDTELAADDAPATTAPAGDQRPAEAGAPTEQSATATPPATPEPATQPATEDPQRVIAALRGQIKNAATQAAAQARQEAEAAARTSARETLKGELEGMIASGELSSEQANAIWAKKQEGWAAEDRQVQETAFAHREASVELRGIHTEAQNSLNHLYHNAAVAMAADTGLTVEQVREYWDDEPERERFQRAVMHHKLAERFPGSGFNASALEDYLEGKVAVMSREATIHRTYTTQLAAKDREIEDLRVQLNREAASNDGITRRDAAPRGGGGDRTKAPERMEDITASALLAGLRGR